MIAGAPAQIYAGTVVTLQTGVNVLGGTPVKPQAERERTGDQLRDDVDAMNPDISPEVTYLINLMANAQAPIFVISA